MSLPKLVKKSIYLFCLLWMPLSGQPAASEVLDRVVAKVNSDIVTLSAVEDRMAVLNNKYQAEKLPVPSKKELQKQAIEMIISEKLQIQEAKKLGMEVTEESLLQALDDIKARNNITEEALGQYQREGHDGRSP